MAIQYNNNINNNSHLSNWTVAVARLASFLLYLAFLWAKSDGCKYCLISTNIIYLLSGELKSDSICSPHSVTQWLENFAADLIRRKCLKMYFPLLVAAGTIWYNMEGIIMKIFYAGAVIICKYLFLRFEVATNEDLNGLISTSLLVRTRESWPFVFIRN